MLKEQHWSMWFVVGYLVLLSSCTTTSVIPTPEATLLPSQPLTSPTKSSELSTANPRYTMAPLIESSMAYQEIVQRGDYILKAEVGPSGYVVVFFASIGKDKGGTPVPEFSTIGVTVLRADTHEKLWEKVTDIESPLAYDRPVTSFPWLHRYFELRDLTQDGQPEIVIGGCTGFGNRCCYQAAVWSLDGELLFCTEPNRFGGVQFLQDNQAIVIRNGLNIVGQAEADLHPEQWRIDWYAWSGAEFITTGTKIVPYIDFYGPALEE